MVDITWELWFLITCLALLALAALVLWSRWYVERRRRDTLRFVRDHWDSRQDFVHRLTREGSTRRWGGRGK